MAAFTYKSLYDGIANDGDIAHRVEVAAVKAAVDIFTAESGTPNKRTALATLVANNPTNYVHDFTMLCGVDATIFAAGTTPTDAQLLAAVKAAWTLVAGT